MPDAPRTHLETVLVVDDEQFVLDLVGGILSSYGYKVFSAGDGEEALQICRRPDVTIDLLLTDMVMPKMSGAELAQRLARLQSRIRVLYMSGYTQYSIMDSMALESVRPFIWKPFSPSDLLRKVREVLDSPGEIRQA